MNPRNDLEHFAGCLLGGAIGDALGASVEFLTLQEIRREYGQAGITDYSTGEGKFTDDTQMTLFTAEGILRADASFKNKGIWDLVSIYHSYLRWLHTQGLKSEYPHFEEIADGRLITMPELNMRRAPGGTCLSSLESGRMGTVEQPINNSKGCGGVMRVAPVGLAVAKAQAFRIGCEVAAITHGHPSGYLAAGFLASIISSIIEGYSLDDSIADAIRELKQWLNHQECLDRIEYGLAQYKSTANNPSPEVVESIGQGWIAEEALAVSLYCALIGQHDFAKGVLLAVNHGGDSDSTGAITGNILGALLGKPALPKSWIDRLELHSLIEEIASDLISVREGADPPHRQ